MKKMISLLLAVACAVGIITGAVAEPGYETIYGLLSDEQAFGAPYETKDRDTEAESIAEEQALETMGEGEEAKFCFLFFFFDTEYDMTDIWLLGEDAENAGKLVKWRSDYSNGATIMCFMLSKFADFKAAMAEDVDFAIAYSFDGGENMMTYDTAEAAEEFTRMLEEQAAATEGAE